jgi:hypothetical protein
VIAAKLRQRCRSALKTAIVDGKRPPVADFVTKSRRALRYSQIGLIRALASLRESGHTVVTAFPWQSITLQRSRRVELESMLPGFRFLFTAIVLSISILVFGLGAAALLRAAHEEFANHPSRRATPEPMFARLNDGPPPTLSLLRVDPPVAEKKPAENVVPGTVPEAAPDVPAPAGQTLDTRPAEPGKLAALTSVEPMQTEAAKPEEPSKEATAETPAAPAPAAAATEAPVANAEVKIAAIAATPEPAAATPPPTSPEPPADIPPFDGSIATTLIATLGGPAVLIDEKTSSKEAKPDRSAVKKRAAERARERRRIVAARRARLAREATLTLQQQQPNPFLPFPGTPATR